MPDAVSFREDTASEPELEPARPPVVNISKRGGEHHQALSTRFTGAFVGRHDHLSSNSNDASFLPVMRFAAQSGVTEGPWCRHLYRRDHEPRGRGERAGVLWAAAAAAADLDDGRLRCESKYLGSGYGGGAEKSCGV